MVSNNLIIIGIKIKNIDLIKKYINDNTEIFLVDSNSTQKMLLEYVKGKTYDSVGYFTHYQNLEKHYITPDVTYNITNDKGKLVNFWNNFNTSNIYYLGWPISKNYNWKNTFKYLEEKTFKKNKDSYDNTFNIKEDNHAYELFGVAKYNTETWNEESETTYYDIMSDEKLGSAIEFNDIYAQSTQTSYYDPDHKLLGTFWSNGYDSHWNTRSEKVKKVTFDFNNDFNTQIVNVVFIQETHTWNREIDYNTYQDYYSTDGNYTFLGTIHIHGAITTRYDASWNKLDEIVDMSSILSV